MAERQSKAADKIIVERMKETRELLADFGLVLHGYDPGVTAYVKSDPRAVGNGWAQEPISLDHNEWQWLEPLLNELRSLRHNVPAKTNMTRQEFSCERCGVESHINLDSYGSVYENCERIRTDHQKWSPECAGDLSTI